VPLQALLVEVYEREGAEAGLEEAAQVKLSSDATCHVTTSPRTKHARIQPLHPIIPSIHPQICETLAMELDPVRVRYWLGVVQARIHRRLVADIASPAASS
jgi:hypothetical protein